MNTTDIERSVRAAAERFTQINTEKYLWSFAHPGLKERVVELLTLIRRAMYPGIFGEKPCAPDDMFEAVNRCLGKSVELLRKMLLDVLPDGSDGQADEITHRFITGLPEIAEYLATDIKAAYEGDPAARSEEEIMLAYPAFEAISIYRLAHSLHQLKVPLIPRMMTEYAHRITGIDIHPGATIGRYFFIDHGTGVVIGETCTIGERVKLYQGVTLGAKSFELDEDGNPIKGIKRHPDIGNHVVIYAGATILGGDTVIGDNCIIGSNVWLLRSTKAGEKIFYNNAN